MYYDLVSTTFICLPVDSACSMMTAVMMGRKLRRIIKKTRIASEQQLTIRNGRGKGLCWRRAWWRRQDWTDGKRAWKLTTSFLIIKLEVIWGGLCCWRIRDSRGCIHGRWKRGEHLCRTFECSQDGTRNENDFLFSPVSGFNCFLDDICCLSQENGLPTRHVFSWESINFWKQWLNSLQIMTFSCVLILVIFLSLHINSLLRVRADVDISGLLLLSFVLMVYIITNTGRSAIWPEHGTLTIIAQNLPIIEAFWKRNSVKKTVQFSAIVVMFPKSFWFDSDYSYSITNREPGLNHTSAYSSRDIQAPSFLRETRSRLYKVLVSSSNLTIFIC